MSQEKVLIFDTTLRDGEQSPGASLSVSEKLEIAHQLAVLGVDIIEAGFPVSSPAQFEATQKVAEQVTAQLSQLWPGQTKRTSKQQARLLLRPEKDASTPSSQPRRFT